MGRLIDADELLEKLSTVAVNRSIDNQFYMAINKIRQAPTAYSVDKVVEELETCFRREYNGEDEGFNYGIRKAIEIVWGGGKNE